MDLQLLAIEILMAIASANSNCPRAPPSPPSNYQLLAYFGARIVQYFDPIYLHVDVPTKN